MHNFADMVALFAGSNASQLARVREGVVFLIALILSIAVHEFGHAFIADKLGDDTPRQQGRVTLNPIVHADPIGTLIFPMVGFFFMGGVIFGWGKPVMVNPTAFTRRFRMKVSHLFVAIAGPIMNVVLALIVTGILAALLATGVIKPLSPIFRGIYGVILLNWILFFFNLIPCPPLDGGAVLAGLLPDKYNNVVEFLQQYGFIILLGLLLTGAIGIFVRPAVWLTQWMVTLVLPLAA